jgi:hypothetical protein
MYPLCIAAKFRRDRLFVHIEPVFLAFATRHPSAPVTQTPFQRTLWLVATDAHAAGDRADARIMMRMIETIDEGDYANLAPLVAALRPMFRDRLGRIPNGRAHDHGHGAEAEHEA